MTLAIVRRTEDEFDAWLRRQSAKASERLESLGLNPKELLSTELGWLMCLPKFEGRLLDFDLYQLRFLTVRARYRSILKARQVGFSFEIAAECVARCHLKERHTAICVSYNLDDAKEKIRLVKELHEELPLEFQKKMVIDSKTEVGFASNTRKRQLGKVISYPSKAPRGKTGDVYLDEIAHCANDRQIYAGATALIIRSGGQLTMGSTPLGQRGIFYDIHSQHTKQYPGFWRQEVPWWLCRQFSTIADDPAAVAICELLETEERVARFGTPDLKGQFEQLPLEDFQQEFELAFQDERVSFFPYDLIKPSCMKERHEIPVFDSLERLAAEAGRLGPLYMGFDVGRTKHPSELVVFENVGPLWTLRYEEQFKEVPFPLQRERLIHVMDTVGSFTKKFRIDSTGLGRNLGEDLERRFGRKIELVQFTQNVKSELANSSKILFEERNIVLPNDKLLIAQFHSLKQKITTAGNAIFDVEKNRFHHGDKMWAISLATFQKNRRRRTVAEAGVRVIGASTPGPAAPKEKGLVERLFTVPKTTGELIVEGVAKIAAARAEQEALRSAPLPQVERLCRSVAVSLRVYLRDGDEEKAKALATRYKRLRREIVRRRTAGKAGTS